MTPFWAVLSRVRISYFNFPILSLSLALASSRPLPIVFRSSEDLILKTVSSEKWIATSKKKWGIDEKMRFSRRPEKTPDSSEWRSNIGVILRSAFPREDLIWQRRCHPEASNFEAVRISSFIGCGIGESWNWGIAKDEILTSSAWIVFLSVHHDCNF